jgi:hypothetical protein
MNAEKINIVQRLNSFSDPGALQILPYLAVTAIGTAG